MASSAHRKKTVTKNRTVTSKNALVGGKRRAQMLVDDVTAILLISPNAKRLCEFYKKNLGLPLQEEAHDGIPLHYGYSLGDVHFAIHPADGWPGVPTANAQGPVISFGSSNLKAVIRRLSLNGIPMTGPTDHGFAQVISFRDPDGNSVSILEYNSNYW